MKKTMALLIAAFVVVVNVWSATVTNVRGQQRQNSNIVDVYYDLNASEGGTYMVDVAFEGKSEAVPEKSLTGAVGGGVAPGKNRHVIWDAGADWAGKKGQVKAVVTATKETVKGKAKKVQLWAGGPYWADRNIGAQAPWESGYHFWWGDTIGYKWENNMWVASNGYASNFSFTADNILTGPKSISTLQSEGWIVAKGGTYVLTPEHDAAQVQWGGGWRMPTYQELCDLYNKCNWYWTTQNGVKGYIVRGRGEYASNSIFLPCTGIGYGTSLNYSDWCGVYWSSVPYSDSYNSWTLDFGGHSLTHLARFGGQSVRPVQGFTK